MFLEPMSSSQTDFYGGHSPTEIPMYSYAAASRYIGVPASTVSWWVKGRLSHGYKPILTTGRERGLTFLDLVEVAAVRQLRRVHGLSLASIRNSVLYAEKELDIPRLLLRSDLRTFSGDLFLEHLGHLISLSKSGQIAMRKLLEMYLERVEHGDDHLPKRYFPEFTGVDLVEDRKPVSISPHVSFGLPTMAGTRVHTRVVAHRVNAGEQVSTLASDYRVPEGLIVSVLSFEAAA